MRSARFDPRRGATPRDRAHAGFTLMDLMLSITLAAILGATGFPVLYQALVEFRLTAAAEEILGAVEYARSRAVVTGSQTRVTFDTNAETVLVEELLGAIDLGATPGREVASASIETRSYQAVPHPLNRGNDYQLALSRQGWSGAVDLVSVDFGAGLSVVFDARGVPSAGGTVLLESSGVQMSLLLDSVSGAMAP